MEAILIGRERADPNPVRGMMLIDIRATRQFRRRHRPRRHRRRRRLAVRRVPVLRQRGRGRARGLVGARELREARLRVGEGALVHAFGLGLGHVGLGSFRAFPGTAFADEDSQCEERDGSATGYTYGDADFCADGQTGF